MLRLSDVDRVAGEVRHRGPVTPPVRYGRERPGELILVDVKKAARIPDAVGHSALDAATARSAGPAGPSFALWTTIVAGRLR